MLEEFQFLKRKIKIINKSEEEYGEGGSREKDNRDGKQKNPRGIEEEEKKREK